MLSRYAENKSITIETMKSNKTKQNPVKTANQGALSDIENRYLTIFENTGTGIVLIDDDTTIVAINERFAKLLGYTKENREQLEGTLKWTFETGGVIHSSPAVIDGIVYFGSRDSYFYALNAETGHLLWKFQTGSWVLYAPVSEQAFKIAVG